MRRLLRVPDGNTTLVALRTQISYDQRDNPFTPTRGYYVSGSGELASTLTASSDDQASQFLSRFIKLQFTAISGYIPLGHSVVLAATSCALVASRISRKRCRRLIPNRAFFLGGVDTHARLLPR